MLRARYSVEIEGSTILIQDSEIDFHLKIEVPKGVPLENSDISRYTDLFLEWRDRAVRAGVDKDSETE